MRKTLLTLALAIGAFSTALNAVVLGPTLKDISTYFNVSDARAGQLGTIHSVIAAMVGILAAPLLDRYGPKRVLRFECVMLLAGTAISALAPSFALLFVGRAVAGIGGAIIAATCFVCVSQIFTDPVERNRKVGVVTSASSVAGVIGVPLLVIIGQHASWRWSIGSLAIPLLVVVIATWSLPSAENDGPRQSLRDEYVDRFRTVGQSRATVLLLGSFAAAFVVWGGVLIYIGAYFETVFDANPGSVSLMFFAIGVASILASNVAPRVLERFPMRICYSVFALFTSANLLAAGTIYITLRSMMLFAVLVSLGIVGVLLTTIFLLLDSLPSATGTVMSLQSAMSEVGFAAGAAIGGLALTVFHSYPAMFHTFGLILPAAFGLTMLAIRSSQRQAKTEEVTAAQTT